jgi:type VI protein secretion system component Hcp
MKLTITMIAVLGLGSLANAQQTQSAITIDSGDLACSTTAGAHAFAARGWSFTATNPPATTGVAGAGRVQISSLTIEKTFDECSATLFAAVTTGKHLNKLTLTQTDASGRIKEMTVTLGDVVLSNYQLGGTPNTAEPVESISFSFIQITIANLRNNSHAGWDMKAMKQLP